MTIRIALLAFLVGVIAGYHIDLALMPQLQVLGKTDGAICFGQVQLQGYPTSGPHWLVRPDGLCWAEDMPK